MMSFMKVSERRCCILGLMLLIATLTLSLTMSLALADSDKRVVKVMTQNMDAGTDLLFFFVTDPITATQLTYTNSWPLTSTAAPGCWRTKLPYSNPI